MGDRPSASSCWYCSTLCHRAPLVASAARARHPVPLARTPCTHGIRTREESSRARHAPRLAADVLALVVASFLGEPSVDSSVGFAVPREHEVATCSCREFPAMLRRLRLSAVAITGDLWSAIALVFGEFKGLSNRPSAPKAHQVTVFLSCHHCGKIPWLRPLFSTAGSVDSQACRGRRVRRRTPHTRPWMGAGAVSPWAPPVRSSRTSANRAPRVWARWAQASASGDSGNRGPTQPRARSRSRGRLRGTRAVEPRRHPRMSPRTGPAPPATGAAPPGPGTVLPA